MDIEALVKSLVRYGTHNRSQLTDRISTRIKCVTLKSVGEGCVIERSAELRNPAWITLGESVVIKRFAILNGRTNSMDSTGIQLGNFNYVREFSYIDSYGGRIATDDNVAIGQACVIDGEGGVEIGKYTMVGSHVHLIGSNHRYESIDLPYKMQGNTARGIKIGSNVWIGSGSILLDGVTVGDNSVVMAGSIVTRSIPPDTIHSDSAPRRFRLRNTRSLVEWRDVLQPGVDDDHRR